MEKYYIAYTDNESGDRCSLPLVLPEGGTNRFIIEQVYKKILDNCPVKTAFSVDASENLPEHITWNYVEQHKIMII
jgi:hypothetical protein